METYRFDGVTMSEELWGILRRLGEMWPDELRIAEVVELNCFSNRAAAIVAHLGGEQVAGFVLATIEERAISELPEQPLPEIKEIYHETHEKEDQPAQDAGAPICLNCQQPFERRRGGNKFCSPECSKKYYNEQRKKQPLQDEGTNADGTQIYLDIQTGNILSIQEINQGLRNGDYGPGRRFRRGDTRVYVVEQKMNRSGAVKWRLKQVYGQEGEQ